MPAKTASKSSRATKAAKAAPKAAAAKTAKRAEPVPEGRRAKARAADAQKATESPIRPAADVQRDVTARDAEYAARQGLIRGEVDAIPSAHIVSGRPLDAYRDDPEGGNPFASDGRWGSIPGQFVG